MSTRRPQDPSAAGGASGDRPQGDREADALAGHDILRLRAPNSGLLTLSGTNTWLVGRRPTWVVDPGPAIAAHLERLIAAIDDRGGLGGVALTHDHEDHSAAVKQLLAARPAPLAAGRGGADVRLADQARFGPFEALATPGHAPDHFALVANDACFTGDAVLGEGSVFISPYPGAMAGYLLALTRLRLREDFSVLCPGHGPPVWDARAKLQEYLDHRRDREKRLVAALDEGRRTVPELLDAAWSDVPETLRPVAAVTLAAHLDKLEDERLLPVGVERPQLEHADI
jgi:glyoxylase-like metal-dependent hydrolase (beta-lactamase superfamily II)